MYTDSQIFRRCCFCLPLRPGLLAWGYVKMVFLLWFTAYLGYHFRHHPDPFNDVWLISLVSVLMIESIFNVLLLVAAHRKSSMLLFVYSIYVMVESAALVVLVTLFIVMRLDRFPRAWYNLISLMSFPLLDVYLLLLVRFEVKKLEKEKLSCSFVNNEAETRCQINKEEITV